jgi:hypothetical protein
MRLDSTLLLLALVALAAIPAQGAAAAPRPRRIVLIAGKPSHPTMMHEYRAGCALLKKCLEHVSGVEAVLFTNGWPADPHAFDGADAVLLFMDGGTRHDAIKEENLKLLDALMKRGVGLGCLHYAVEVPADQAGKQWQEWIGGYYEHLFSVNPMWEPEFRPLPKHPITRGVKPFRLKDEWYFNMRFRPEGRGSPPSWSGSHRTPCARGRTSTRRAPTRTSWRSAAGWRC